MKQDVETERSCRQAIYGRFASGSHRESLRLQRARGFFNILLVQAAVLASAMPFSAVAAEGLPLLRSIFGSATLGEARFRETINKLNRYGEYAFTEAYRSEQTLAFYSGRGNTSCWLKHHDSDDYADKLTQEIAEYKYPVFRYGNWVGYCTAGDTEKLASQVRYILIGAGEWRE